MIGGKAYNLDPLDAELAKLDIELIAPRKINRKKTQTQDGCKLRWKIERLFSLAVKLSADCDALRTSCR